jgi:hypothetical protein
MLNPVGVLKAKQESIEYIKGFPFSSRDEQIARVSFNEVLYHKMLPFTSTSLGVHHDDITLSP